MKQENIRNFCIIAHIDHGKSTLADRILELTGAIDKRELKSQMLDSMDLERERGITIKLNAVGLNYKKDNEEYLLNLIDTPGHVDFSYEVSRSLAACEGALLVVDAAQGVEAQTLANLYLALENDLTIIPVINKIDLPSADPDKVIEELETIGFDKEDIVLTSAKTGVGVDKLLDKIIEKIPSPKGDINKPLKALIFDSLFDPYRGVVTSIRVIDGKLKVGDIMKMMETNTSYDVVSLSVNTPKEKQIKELVAGEVGHVYASIKSISDVHVGDTITLESNPAKDKLPGYKPMKPTVYSGIFPIESNKFEDLREALGKLKLNDAALTFEPETSKALGFGFRCGFLGLLHMDIVEERIEREFGIDIIATSPSVVYEVIKTNKENYERIVAEFLKTRLKPYGIKVIDSGWEDFIVTKIAGRTIVMVHGDKDGFNKVAGDFAKLLRQPIDEVYMSHYHAHREQDDCGTQVIINGSLVSTDDYAMTLRKHTDAVQLLRIYGEDVCCYRLKLK